MGTPLGPKYIPYTYMDPLGIMAHVGGGRLRATYESHDSVISGV